MDQNFIKDLVASGEKRFEFDVPLNMSFADALENIKGTLAEIVRASDSWEDQGGLRHAIALEAETWLGIFKKAQDSTDESALVTQMGDPGAAEALLGLAASGSAVMKHFKLEGKKGAAEIKMFLVFSMGPGPKFQTSIDFG